MKKVKVLVLALLSLGIQNFETLQAKPVSVDVAKTVAANFYGQTYNKTVSPQLLTISYIERDNNGQPVYYVFNVEGNKGFIIVSAEDAGSPILGSSTTGQYVISTSNNNVGFWMNRRKSEIISIRANNVVAAASVSDEWNGYINNAAKKPQHLTVVDSVSPLCKTLWDQSPYYNYDCPGSGSLKAVTGCVATAMAQIMKYWEFPAVGLDSNCYDETTAGGDYENYGNICAKFDTSHYVWSEMPNIVGSAQYKQCAKLMYDCGVSVNMDYGPTESGAYVIATAPSALNSYVQYFNYDASTIKSAIQGSHGQELSSTNFLALIETELNDSRPVQFQGTDPSLGGHSWVCDGYNTAGHLHMNWGWSGQSDGWYTTASLTPAGEPYDFSEEIGVIYEIKPNPLAYTAVSQIKNNNQAFEVYPNPGNGKFTIQSAVVNGQWSVEVYNVLGQEVYSQANIQQSTFSIDLSNQPKGVYVYRIIPETGSQISTGRLIIE